jgi:hypothetical protein
MSKTLLTSRKLVEIFSDPVTAVNQLGLHTKIRDFSVPDLEINFNNGGVEFIRGSGEFYFKRASEATYFDTDGILKRVTINEPRIEQNGLLIEAPSINYIKGSEDFSNKTKSYTTITDVDDVLSPDNISFPQKLKETNADNYHYIQFDNTEATRWPIQSLGTTGSGHYVPDKFLTFSIFVKAAERSVIKLAHIDNDGVNVRTAAVFDLDTGTMTSSTLDWDVNSYTPTSEFYSDAVANNYCRIKKIIKAGVNEEASESWYRISISTYTGADTSFPVIRLYINNQLVDHDGDWSYSGNTSSGIYLWGAQFEPMPYPTSYIYSPLVAGTISQRQGDYAWISNAAENVPQPHVGDTAYIVDFDLLGRYHPVSSASISGRNPLVAGEAHKYAYLTILENRDLFGLAGFSHHLGQVISDGNLVSYYNGVSPTATYDLSVTSDNVFTNLIRAAFIYNANLSSIYINGLVKATDSTVEPAKTGVPTHISLGHFGSTSVNDGVTITGGEYWLNGHIDSFRIFRRSLDQQELMLL